MNQIDIETMSDSKSKLTAHSEASLSRPSAWPIPLVLSQTADSKELLISALMAELKRLEAELNLLESSPQAAKYRSSVVEHTSDD